MDFFALAQQCAPAVHPQTMAAIVHVESGFNPYAIGVVGGRLERQPKNKVEAVSTAKALEKAGFNFSIGLGQVNRYNLAKYDLDYERSFDPCPNLRAASSILKDCYARAKRRLSTDQAALQAALSCYYSGNFSTGFKPDFSGQPSYVQKVLKSVRQTGVSPPPPTPISVVASAASKNTQSPANDHVFRVTTMDESKDAAPVAVDVYTNAANDLMVFR